MGVDVSIIVPTLNEADNLPLLVDRIAAAMAGTAHEILVVDDDSRDATPAVCSHLATRYPLRLIVRTGATDGLGGAVLRGFAEARGHTFVVMDADLQHPPEVIPQLLAALDAGADFALGSRYTAGGSTEGRWGLVRKLNSWVATVLARPFAGRTRDPMSGFFALRRSTFDRARRLAPLGYKIGLELMCKCRVRNIVEVPIRFAARARGQSKLTLAEQFRYLEHLSRLYDFTFPRASAYFKFLVVLALGWALGLALAALLVASDLAPPAAAIALSYAGNVLVTAAFHLRYVRVQRQFLLVRRPWGAFWLTSAAEWLACATAAAWLWSALRTPRLLPVLLLSYSLATVVRYILRKELGQDLRGLRYEPRAAELQ